MNDKDYILKVVLEGLSIMCASPEERKRHFAKPDSIVDENFDFIVLDYLAGAVEANLIPKETASGIEALYTEADQFLSTLNWQQEDALLKASPNVVTGWQNQASEFIKQIKAHNKCKQQD